MLKIISPLLILGLLQSCSDPNLQGGIHSNSLRNSTVVPDKDLQTSSDGQGSTDNTPATRDSPKTESGLKSDETILSNTPVVNPTIIAGASLTCIESSPKVELRCTIKVNGVLTDLNPLGIFIIQGKQSSWSPLPFARNAVGTYLARLSNPPASYGIAMKFDKSEYAMATVGAAPLEFANVIKDGGFEAMPSNSGVNPYSFASVDDLLASQSPWEIKKSSYKGCDAAGPLVQVFNDLNAKQSYEGNKFVALDTLCAGVASNANISINQKFQAKLSHFYQVSHAREVSGGGTGLTAEIDIYWNGERHEIDTTSAAWILDVRYFLSEESNEDNRISFHETGNSDGIGTQIDSVQVLDFGAPI